MGAHPTGVVVWQICLWQAWLEVWTPIPWPARPATHQPTIIAGNNPPEPESKPTGHMENHLTYGPGSVCHRAASAQWHGPMRSGRLYTRKKGQEGPGLFGSDGQKPSSMQKPGSMKVAKGVSTREKQKPTKPSTTHQHTSGASNNTVDRKQLSCGPGPQHQISCRGFCAQRGHNAHFCRTRSQSTGQTVGASEAMSRCAALCFQA